MIKLRKIILIIIALLIIAVGIFFIFNGANVGYKVDNKIQVISSNFASYDFLRAIIGDNKNVELTYLIGPGKDIHSYEPSARDLIKIQNANLFVYLSNESEQWADKVLDSIENTNTEVICISDFVDKITEQEIDGAEEENEHDEEESFDEHIWTSPKNAIKMVETLEQYMEKIDSSNSEIYKKNSELYISKIQEVDKKIQDIVDNKIRNRLIFADKMPMQYFMNDYNLEVSSAFNGCSTETDPSAKTIAYLEENIKENKIPVVLYIELNSGKIAKIISDDVGNYCEPMQIQSLQNISLDDFNNGETWVSLMTRNLEVLKKALQ